MNRTRFVLGILSAALAASAAIPAIANIKSDDVSGYKVTQYFDLVYSAQNCNNQTAYDISYSAVRYYRQDTTRQLGSAPLRMGQVFVANCAGNNTDASLSKDVNPRFDGSQLWSSTYTTSVGWGWGRAATTLSAMGANQKINVKDGAGNRLGSLCSVTYLIGSGDCS